ncbi:uncharacterized protein B0P05DRAFT_544963 [Gilbertella persicaria]|uniref:uncharacterized protein n=1 Tax=Gilbertella persicaria TaxID=101096 RepID=UPI002220313D|nr:uncharacterized protein B0P05DRAFT_544963 [Gilbertella persicaria]KAI8076564.1 hypothetical protein B0P05DRAFT_544963 [Gilbertella persicaria]
MCGRFCCSLEPNTIRMRLQEEKVLEQSDIEWVNEEKYHTSYNFCPWQFVPALFEHGQKHTKLIQSMQWGFIASWIKNASYQRPINARSETLIENQHGLFQKSKNAFRCVIAAEGFYEWNKKKQPFYIKRKDGQLMLFAGLYATSNVDGKVLTTCAIVTTETNNQAFQKIHNRIPVILEPQDVNTWIDKTKSFTDKTSALLRPFEGELDIYQVSTDVNSTKVDSSTLILPLDQKKSSISRFLQPSTTHDESKKSTPDIDKVKYSHTIVLSYRLF